MRQGWLFAHAWAAAWLSVACAHASDPLDPADLVKTTSRAFCIPFEASRDPAVDYVQLLVSHDGGTSWNVADAAVPQAGEFKFKAPFAGEFWFCVRTVDKSGSVTPSEPVAELRVAVVDAERADLAAAVESLPPPSAVQAVVVADAAPATRAPNGVSPKLVNARTFEIDYDSPSDRRPREAAVWLTSDGGQSWRRFAVDHDGVSPARITVPHDGVFGLWMVIADADGHVSAEPQAGETAGVWIAVDTVKPVARFTTAEASVRAGRPELTIRWEASDAQLAARPVTLSFRQSPDEPWRLLQGQLANTGSQIVAVGSNLPESIYLRMEVTDESGNVATAETSQPVSTVVRVAGRDSTSGRGPRTYQILQQ